MSDLILTIKRSFNEKRVAIIGDLVADQFLSGSITRVSREAPVFILKHTATETRPGGAANAAANVAALGGIPLLVGVIGGDANGRTLGGSLTAAGVSTAFVCQEDGLRTTTKVRVLAGQNYSAKQQVIRIDYENEAGVDDALASRLIENLRAAAKTADAMVVSDYGYGVVSGETYHEARKLANEAGIPLIVDSRFRLRELTDATAATPNLEEVENILGHEFTDDDGLRLCRELGYGSLLVTCGNKGMIVIEPGREPVHLAAIGPPEPVDVTGAGDTVIAAFSLGLAAGLDLCDAAAIANHAGGIVVMKKGTATASREELLRSLAGSELPETSLDAAV